MAAEMVNTMLVAKVAHAKAMGMSGAATARGLKVSQSTVTKCETHEHYKNFADIAEQAVKNRAVRAIQDGTILDGHDFSGNDSETEE